MKYETSEKEGIVIITPKGKMTGEAELEKLDGKIKEFIRIGARRMVINLLEVPFMDSRGLSVLLAALTSLNKVGGELKIVSDKIDPDPDQAFVHPPSPKSPIFPLLGVTHKSIEEALKNFQTGS